MIVIIPYFGKLLEKARLKRKQALFAISVIHILKGTPAFMLSVAFHLTVYM